MSSIKRMMRTLSAFLRNAEENASIQKRTLRDEEPFLQSLSSADKITVGQLRAAIAEISYGELRIGNRAVRIIKAPKSVPTHKVCQLCAFNHPDDPQHRTCPKLSFGHWNRALCTFIGEGSKEYFEEVD